MERVYLIRIAFSGKDFYGTQKQKDKPTIQGLFEDLLSRIYVQSIKVTISSRLDRYVSALDFGLSFIAPNDRYDKSYLFYYLSRRTPSSVSLLSIEEKDRNFSARYSVKEKTYQYFIQNKKPFNPIYEPFSYVPKKELDVLKRKEALSLFKGKHDFSSFSVPEEEGEGVLNLSSASLKEEKGRIIRTFKGKSFLRYQIRCRVGACIQYQEGKLTLDKIERRLQGEEREYAKRKADGKGLILIRTDYFGDGKKKNSPIRLGKLL